MEKYIRDFIKDIKKEALDKKNNGPIIKTADQLWKYSGEIEKTNPHLALYNEYYSKANERK
tara:strand:- start:458 stop:640 length:183 start_codon:yes stop_codon:yes gene_type:complete